LAVIGRGCRCLPFPVFGPGRKRGKEAQYAAAASADAQNKRAMQKKLEVLRGPAKK